MDFYSEDPLFLRQASRLLTEHGCCSHCTLRFMGLNQMHKYRDDAKEMAQMVNKLHNLKTEDATTDEDKTVEVDSLKTDSNGVTSSCVVCLGILQEYMSAEFLEQIRSEVIDKGYVFSTYMCSLMTPVSVILRENALLLFLKDKFSGQYEKKKFSDICSIKDIWKWRNGPLLRDVLKAPFDKQSPFMVNINWEYKDSDKECNFLLTTMSDTFRRRKKDKRVKKSSSFSLYNRANVAKAVEMMSEAEYRSNFQCPPGPATCNVRCDITCQQDSVYLAGRYNKYSRNLSQTPWFIEGERRSESSVQELLCIELNKHFKSTEQKFSSSGREDVDVLMLGDGRPFVLELINPKQRCFSAEELRKIQEDTNAATKDVRCRDLQIVKRIETDQLKDGEIDKVKLYSALCWTREEVSNEKLNTLNEKKEMTLLQKTPIRVLHRRPLATRDRVIHWMKVDRIDKHHFRLDMSTQAGTYIKEFVHGDFGRTKPNLTTLLDVHSDILKLDVTGVELDWPKRLDAENEEREKVEGKMKETENIKLEETVASKVEETVESNMEGIVESKMEETIGSKMEETVESNMEETAEPDIEKTVEETMEETDTVKADT